MRNTGLSDSQIDGWWDVARVGRWRGSLGGRPTEVEITRRDLEQIARDYDPQLQEAPVTVEHMRSGPALGWVAGLRVTGDKLQARFRDLSERLREWLSSGAYRSRSIEMYKPFTATGGSYLGAVSFLGAAAPAVKGLSPEPSLLEECGQGDGETSTGALVSCAEMGLNDYPEEGKGMDEKGLAERIAGSIREMFRAGDDSAPERLRLLDEEIAGLRAALAAEREARERVEAEMKSLLSQLEERGRREELAGFESALDEAAREGRITPSERDGCLKLGERLDASGRDTLLEEVIGRREPMLFREFAAAEEQKSSGQLENSRARFDGFPEDPEHDAALELMAREPGLGFAEALSRVRGAATAV